MTDADLERRRERFDALFSEHVTGVASYCRWRSDSSSDGQDAVGEVFLVAWRRLDEVPGGEQARPWLYATARRVIANQARANARRSRLRERLHAQPVAAEAEDDPLVVRVREALAALGPRDREVLLLAEWEGLTAAEIALVVHRPAVAVRSRLHRARRRFRAVFESQTPAGDDDASARLAAPPSMATSRSTTLLSLRSTTVSTTPSLKALRDASPRNQPDFDALLERYEQLGSQITSTPPGRGPVAAPRATAPADRPLLRLRSRRRARSRCRRLDARRRIAAERVCGRAQGAGRDIGPALRHDDAHGERGEALHPALE